MVRFSDGGKERRRFWRGLTILVVLALITAFAVIWVTREPAEPQPPTTSPSVEPSVGPSVTPSTNPTTSPTTPPTSPPPVVVPPGPGIRVAPREPYLNGRLGRYGELYRYGEPEGRPWAVAFRLPQGAVIKAPFSGSHYVTTAPSASFTNLIWEADFITDGVVYEDSYGAEGGLAVFVNGPALHFPAGLVEGKWIGRGETIAVVADQRGLPIPGLRRYNVLIQFGWNRGGSGYISGSRVVKQFFPYLFAKEEGW